MFRFINIIFCLTISTFLFSILEAQDLGADVIAMTEAYAENEMDVTMYTTIHYEKSKKINFRARVKKSEEGYWCKMNWITFMFNDEYALVINEEDKSISWSKSKSTFSKKPELIPEDLKKQLKKVKWKYMGLSGKSKHYKIPWNIGNYESMNLFLNIENHTISKIIYYYKQTNEYEVPKSMEIVYEKTILNPVFSKTDFSHLKYMKKVKGEWKSTLEYGEYTIFQNDSQ